MPDANETEVKPDAPETPPKEEVKDTVPPESSPEEKSETETEEESEEEESEPEVITPAPEKKVEVIPTEGSIKRLTDETDREFAQRLEIKRLRDNARSDRSKEVLVPPKSTPPVRVESEILKKYKPEEIQSLREVLPELAKELGYVKKDELAAATYEEKAQAEIDAFITSHPEYSPEKDPDSVLWDRLKEEYNSVYRPPQNPKDFKKIFERIHKDLFGIQAAGPLPKLDAAREKVKVASPSGASAPQRLNRSSKASVGLRTDMLKGFSDKEIADIESRAEE